MIWLRACPRCKGDLVEQSDWDGDELVCLQCAFRTALPPGIVLKREPDQRGPHSAGHDRTGSDVPVGPGIERS